MKTLAFKGASALLIGMAAISFVSCSDDEPYQNRTATSAGRDAITFRSGMGTRATETTNQNLDSIFVTAFRTGSTQTLGEDNLYFQNICYVKGANTLFTSDKEYSWLDNNETLRFLSYSPSQDELGADIVLDNNSLVLTDFAVADQISDQVDFITADASGNKKENEVSGVELTFDHRLSQIEIQAKSGSKTYNYKVLGARIGRAQYVGSFDFVTKQWTLDSWHDTAVYDTQCDTTELTTTPVSLMGAAGNAMLIPQTLTPWDPMGDPDNVAREAYLSVLVQITRKDNGMQIYPYPDDRNHRQFGWVSIPLKGTWEQGKKYIYTLDFTNGAGNIDPDDPNPGEPVLGAIKFTVNVNPWVNSDNQIPMTPTLPSKARIR